MKRMNVDSIIHKLRARIDQEKILGVVRSSQQPDQISRLNSFLMDRAQRRHAPTRPLAARPSPRGTRKALRSGHNRVWIPYHAAAAGTEQVSCGFWRFLQR